jgi:hypothetical protein
MSDPEDELTPDERRFVARVAGAYQAPSRSPAQSAAFQQELDARLAHPRAGRWLPAFAGVLAAAALAWLAIGVGREQAPREQAQVVTAEEAILGLSADAPSDEEALPEEYVAIASLFLDR